MGTETCEAEDGIDHVNGLFVSGLHEKDQAQINAGSCKHTSTSHLPPLAYPRAFLDNPQFESVAIP